MAKAKAKPSTRAKWRALRSARSGTLKKSLTAPTLLETRFIANQRDQKPLIHRKQRRSSSAIPMYRRQLIAIDETVVMIPAAVLHQPTVIMTEDGHKITRKSVLPGTMISQIPYLQRRVSTTPGTISAATPAMTAVCFVLIGFDCRGHRYCDKVTPVRVPRSIVDAIRRLHSESRNDSHPTQRAA